MSGLPSILQHLSGHGDAAQAERVRDFILLMNHDLIMYKSPKDSASDGVMTTQSLLCSHASSSAHFYAERDPSGLMSFRNDICIQVQECCEHPDLPHMLQVDRWLEYATYIVGGGALEPACRLHSSTSSLPHASQWHHKLTQLSRRRVVLWAALHVLTHLCL